MPSRQKKKPVYCSKCKDINTMHTHFNNLKIWLKSVNKLNTYKVDNNDLAMCAAFGKVHKAGSEDDC